METSTFWPPRLKGWLHPLRVGATSKGARLPFISATQTINPYDHFQTSLPCSCLQLIDENACSVQFDLCWLLLNLRVTKLPIANNEMYIGRSCLIYVSKLAFFFHFPPIWIGMLCEFLGIEGKSHFNPFNSRVQPRCALTHLFNIIFVSTLCGTFYLQFQFYFAKQNPDFRFSQESVAFEKNVFNANRCVHRSIRTLFSICFQSHCKI